MKMLHKIKGKKKDYFAFCFFQDRPNVICPLVVAMLWVPMRVLKTKFQANRSSENHLVVNSFSRTCKRELGRIRITISLKNFP